jgi:tetratricopeptide (TPR) repeat protein
MESSMKLRPILLAFALLATPLSVSTARAQSAAEHIALGDRDHMDAAGAARHFDAAAKLEPNNYEALWKASYWAVEAGQALKGDAQKEKYAAGVTYGREAIRVNPNDAEGHFVLARALGRTAQSLGSRDKVKYAGDVRSQAMEALRLNPKHPGALHVMGVWNAEVMRLNGISRFMAKNFLGGKVFDSANWDDAQRYLEEAVAIEPTRLVHRLDLAQIYLDRGDKAKAREQLDVLLRTPGAEASDAAYKADGQAMMNKLR